MSLVLPSSLAGDASSEGSAVAAAQPVVEVTPQQLRQMQISEFCVWLRTQTNKHKRPFQEQTIIGYAETARALERWMTEQKIDGDFTVCDVAVLNTFFASYRAEHGQGGTNTRQRNLHHIFKWLALRYGHADPWASPDLVRYGPAKSRPSTLSEGFIRDLLEVTGSGRGRSFNEVRDHAIIRMFTEGVRREELAQQHLGDLCEDLIARPFVRVVPLKGAREFTQGRLVPRRASSAHHCQGNVWTPLTFAAEHAAAPAATWTFASTSAGKRRRQ